MRLFTWFKSQGINRKAPGRVVYDSYKMEQDNAFSLLLSPFLMLL